MSASITLLIPTFNRIRALAAVWPSYFGHPDVAKLIVIDDASTDGTKERVEEWATRAPIPVSVIRHETQRGQPASRMSGIAASETEWVLFGEDDVWLASNYCSTLLREAKDLGASMIAGRIVTALVPDEFNTSCLQDPLTPIRPADEVFDLANMSADFAARTAAPIPAPFLHSIALIRRSAFSAVVFDTWYEGNAWREETDFYLAAGALGLKSYFTPSTVCYHLRGPISASGGHRINRIRFELFVWRNTRYLVMKHWDYLQRAYGLRGSADGWMMRYFARRQIAQLKRIATGGVRSTYRGKK